MNRRLSAFHLFGAVALLTSSLDGAAAPSEAERELAAARSAVEKARAVEAQLEEGNGGPIENHLAHVTRQIAVGTSILATLEKGRKKLDTLRNLSNEETFLGLSKRDVALGVLLSKRRVDEVNTKLSGYLTLDVTGDVSFGPNLVPLTHAVSLGAIPIAVPNLDRVSARIGSLTEDKSLDDAGRLLDNIKTSTRENLEHRRAQRQILQAAQGQAQRIVALERFISERPPPAPPESPPFRLAGDAWEINPDQGAMQLKPTRARHGDYVTVTILLSGRAADETGRVLLHLPGSDGPVIASQQGPGQYRYLWQAPETVKAGKHSAGFQAMARETEDNQPVVLCSATTLLELREGLHVELVKPAVVTRGEKYKSGQLVCFFANCSGGAAPLTATWQYGKKRASLPVSDGQSRFDAALSDRLGTEVTVEVVDAEGNSATDRVALQFDPVRVELEGPKHTVVVGQEFMLRARVSGMLPPFRYAWSDVDMDKDYSGVTQDSTVLVRRLTQTLPGTRTFTVNLKQTLEGHENRYSWMHHGGKCRVTVIPTNLTVTVKGPEDVVVEERRHWTVDAHTGSQADTYNYIVHCAVDGGDLLAQNVRQWPMRLMRQLHRPGDSVLEFTVLEIDRNTGRTRRSGKAEVRVKVSAKPLKLDVEGPLTLDVNVSGRYFVEVSGGHPPYRLNLRWGDASPEKEWTRDTPGHDTFNHAFGWPGPGFSVAATAADSQHQLVTETAKTVVLYPWGKPWLSGPTVVRAGEEHGWTAKGLDLTGQVQYDYKWSVPAEDATFQTRHTYTSPGHYRLSVTAVQYDLVKRPGQPDQVNRVANGKRWTLEKMVTVVAADTPPRRPEDEVEDEGFAGPTSIEDDEGFGGPASVEDASDPDNDLGFSDQDMQVTDASPPPPTQQPPPTPLPEPSPVQPPPPVAPRPAPAPRPQQPQQPNIAGRWYYHNREPAPRPIHFPADMRTTRTVPTNWDFRAHVTLVLQQNGRALQGTATFAWLRGGDPPSATRLSGTFDGRTAMLRTPDGEAWPLAYDARGDVLIVTRGNRREVFVRQRQ